MDRDGDLVRLKRKGHLLSLWQECHPFPNWRPQQHEQVLALGKGHIIFAIVRLLDCINDVPHVAIKGSKRFTDTTAAHVFNAYFTRYCGLAANTETQTPLAMDNCWTPKRRRQELIDDGDSQSSLAPLVFEATKPRP